MAQVLFVIFVLILGIVGLLGLVSIIFGLPGTWIILATTIVYSLCTRYITPWESHAFIGWGTILILGTLCFLAELLEYILGVIGAKAFGTSNWGVAWAILGSIALAILLAPFGFGIGSIIGAFLGAWFGAFGYELFKQKDFRRAGRAGFGAFLGRLGGVLTKLAVAIAMIVIILIHIV